MSPDEEFEIRADVDALLEERTKNREWMNLAEVILERVPGAMAEFRRLHMAQEIKDVRNDG